MSRRERVAILTTSYPESEGDPAGHFVAAEAEALAAEGHAVVVIGAGSARTQPGNPHVVRLSDGGATGWPGLLPRLRARPTRAVGLLRWMTAARRELERLGPFERVIAHWLIPAGFPIALAASAGARLEVVVHGSDARLFARLPRTAAQWVLERLTARGAVLRCVSEELAETLRGLGGSGVEPMIRVEQARIAVRRTRNRDQARRELGLSPEVRLIVIVGRLVPDKRVADALAAATLLPDLSVAVVGDGPERNSLQRRFASVHFAGRVNRDQALSWIAAADVLLSASRLEGAPTVVREARTLGVPVVATNAGDLLRWAERDPDICVIE